MGLFNPTTAAGTCLCTSSAVEKAGLNDLREGAKVTFDIVPNKGKEPAENLSVKSEGS
jgi:cold shock protein